MLRFLYVIFMNLFRAPYMITLMRYEADHPDKFSEETRYKLLRHVVFLMAKTGKITTEAHGVENLPKEGGYVMYPNHQGKYDALGIITTHNKPCSLIMDEAKSHTILVSEFIDLAEGKRLKKSDVRQALRIINDVTEKVKAGKKFILFPEGGYTFYTKNKVSNFKSGSFKCAVTAKAPIVPVALIDSYKVFNSFIMGKLTTQVYYLEPLYYDDYKDLKTIQIATLVKDKLENKINMVLKNQGRI